MSAWTGEWPIASKSEMMIEVIFTYVDDLSEWKHDWGEWLGPTCPDQWMGQDTILGDHLRDRKGLVNWLLERNPYKEPPVKESCCILNCGGETLPKWYLDCDGKIYFEPVIDGS